MFQTDGKKDANNGHNGDGNNGIDHPKDGKTPWKWPWWWEIVRE
jgi:hypothetical protein